MANFDPTTLTTLSITIGILGALMGAMRRGKPKTLDISSGTIAPDKRICVAIVIGGGAILALGLYLAFFQNIALAGAPLALLGLAGILTPIRSFSTLHDVTWSGDAIEGPAKLSGLTLGKTRTRIDWQDARRVGYSVSGNWFVEASDGRRIYWTPIHRGFGALAAAIRHHRPDLKLPANV